MNDIWACSYNPAYPSNLDAHGRELGNASPYDSHRGEERLSATASTILNMAGGG